MDEWNVLDLNNDIERDKFELTQLKVSNYYLYEKDHNIGQVVSNSIEIIDNKMIITINYIDNNLEEVIDVFDKNIELDIINELEKIDLREINNNYVYEDNGNYWSIEYNNKFKICGDFNNIIDEYSNIIKIIDYKNIIDNRLREIYGE